MYKKIALLIMVLLLFSCGRKSSKDGFIKTNKKNVYKIDYQTYLEKPSESDMTISFPELPQTLNPYRANSPSEIFFKNALFSSLFCIDPLTNMPEKNLIENFRIFQNGLEYYFVLKDNIRFNNNKQLTTSDIVYSINLLNTVLKDTNVYNNFFIINKTLKVETLSSLEFKVIIDKPNGNLLYALANFPIIPDEVAKVLSNDVEKFVNYWEIKDGLKIIGSGPYKLDKINEDNSSLIRNDHYFKKDKKGNQLPYTYRVNVNFFSGKNNEIMAFVRKETDILSVGTNDFNNLYTYFDKSKADFVKFIETDNKKEKILLAYNCYRKESNSYLKDIRVRKYLSFFIKKEFEKIKDNLNKKSKLKSININAYNKLFTDINNDGFLEYKDGNTMFLHIVIPEEEKIIVDRADSIKETIEMLNFDVYLEIVPYHIFIEKLFFKNDYDIALFYYSFEPGVISYLHLLDKDELSFYPIVYDDYKTANEIENILYDSLETISLKKQAGIIKRLKNFLAEKCQLEELYSENQYFIINKDIFNFKIKSSLESSFNINTLETMVKIEKKD